MRHYDESLHELGIQTARKQQLERELESLENRRTELDKKELSLRVLCNSEQEDVNRLEERSFINLLYKLSGKMEGELTREKKEAYEAALRHEVAVKELEAVKEDIQQLRNALRDLRDCEQCYNELLTAKVDAIKASGSAAAEEMLRLENESIRLEHQAKEIADAITSGVRAQNAAENAISALNTADNYATWDVYGGGIVADIMKHSHLDESRDILSHLQAELRRFETELADVSIQCNFDLHTDGLLDFADLFFDGLFADLAVRNKICQSLFSLKETLCQLKKALNALHKLKAETDHALEDVRSQIDLLIRDSPV